MNVIQIEEGQISRDILISDEGGGWFGQWR